MPRRPIPDLSVVLAFLRSCQGWSQTDLAEASGVSPNLLNDYEKGRKPLHRERLERLIAAMGLPPETIDGVLDCLASVRSASRAPVDPGDRFAATRRRIDEVAARFGRLAADFSRSALTLLTVEGEALRGRQRAEMLWARLKRRTPAERRALVEDGRDYRHWALCERVAAESRAVAANHPREALGLAELAVLIGEMAPGEEAWRRRLQGYALFHVANGWRVCNDVPAAEAALTRAWKLWREGEPGDPGLLNPAVPPWIEAAVRRAQRRFPEALKRIDEALVLEGGELRAMMLLSKARILETLGDPERSTQALLEAAPLINALQEPKLALMLRFNLVVDLCHLDRFAEAAPRLVEVRGLAERNGEELDLARVVWLEGKVKFGLGQIEEAEAALLQARRTFRTRELAYDHALVSLDLSLVLLSAGRTVELRETTEQMLWIFKAQGIHREALFALRIFCEAVQRETATLEMTRRIARFLSRAQHDPELRFELTERAEPR